MKTTLVEYPLERLENLRAKKDELTEKMNSLELQLRDIERQRLMVTCRIEEIELLFKYASHDEAAIKELSRSVDVEGGVIR